jgi:hypothetical protein
VTPEEPLQMHRMAVSTLLCEYFQYWRPPIVKGAFTFYFDAAAFEYGKGDQRFGPG